jgi:hypothetical protein
MIPPSLNSSAVGLLVSLVVLTPSAATAHCLVTGPKTAVVRSGNAEFRPIGAVRDCATLRLVSGQATAIWTGRDGKVASGPVRPDSGPAGYPGSAATSPVQRIVEVLDTLTDSGRSTRAGYKRFDDGVETADVHVPPVGLRLPVSGPGSWTVVGLRGGLETPIARGSLEAETGLTIVPSQFDGYDALRVRVNAGDRRQQLLLRRLLEAEHAAVDRAIADATAIAELDESSRAIALAMVYDHFGLSLNRDISLMQR